MPIGMMLFIIFRFLLILPAFGSVWPVFVRGNRPLTAGLESAATHD
jgi:hypothetical protein